eukprot:TRINITY_DN494_c0_g1_i1.p1 TRINITY_DN494_c0_g1~~TRINITY_DN494_c0_g1_i1.p1  ORF type:complete len:268 (-),score=20.92 TRINITY_DN494_c0_g1_i1:245-1006(-)
MDKSPSPTHSEEHKRKESPDARLRRSISKSPSKDGARAIEDGEGERIRGDLRRRSRSRSSSRSPRRVSRSPRARRRDSSHSRSPGSRISPVRVLGVFGLNANTTEQDLDDVFSKFGQLTKVQLIMDRQTNRSKRYGFVYFAELDDAIRAKQACNGMKLHDRVIRTDFSVTKKAHAPTPGRYMGHVHGNYRPRSRMERSYDPYPYRRDYPRDYRYDRLPEYDVRYRDRRYYEPERYDDRYRSRYYDDRYDRHRH